MTDRNGLSLKIKLAQNLIKVKQLFLSLMHMGNRRGDKNPLSSKGLEKDLGEET
jgi:hypothetical protein